jgi:hypothetical protein
VNGFSRERDRGLQTVSTLLRVRDVEHRQAEARLQSKQREILRLKREIEGLRQRRKAVLSRRSEPDLRERLLLDALMKVTLERGRQLQALDLQSAVLLSEYRDAKSRLDAAESFRERKHRERELVMTRREEEAASLIAASRGSRERERQGRATCEDS